MRLLTCPLIVVVAAASACSAPGGPYPSLQPRAAENIDPRVSIERPMNERPTAPALLSRLGELVNQARGGDAEFQASADQADRLAAVAGAPQSESWVVAQEALTAAVAARGPIGAALGDIDELGAAALQTQGGIAPNDLAAIQNAAGEVRTIDEREAARVKAIQARLHL